MILVIAVALSLNISDMVPPEHATALCGDGSWSYSLTQRGTCARQLGIVRWINYPDIP